ncbi:hypothetical protein [Pontimicrobium sp. MEBiC01747]
MKIERLSSTLGASDKFMVAAGCNCNCCCCCNFSIFSAEASL